MASLNVRDLGGFIREQRRSAQISLRQLAKQAGVSNPYLSQIERGLRKPSAEILGQIAKALRISAEALYVQAGFLEEREGDRRVVDAILADDGLTERQRQVILEIYDAFRRENATGTGSDAEAVAAGSTRAGVPAAEVAGAVGATMPSVRSTSAKRPAAKTRPARSTGTRSTAAKSTGTTTAAGSAPAKSTAARSAPAKSTAARSAPAKSKTPKSTPAKRAPAKSTPARSTPARSTATRSTGTRSTGAKPPSPPAKGTTARAGGRTGTASTRATPAKAGSARA